MDIILIGILVFLLAVLVAVPIVIVRNIRARSKYKAELKSRGYEGTELKALLHEFDNRHRRHARGYRHG